MDSTRFQQMTGKYFLPYHWTRDPLGLPQVVYQGYMVLAVEELGDPPGLVLDIGCGDGRISAQFAGRGARVVGLDMVERAIGFARLLVPEATFAVHDARQPIDDVHVAPASVDHAFMIDMYEHIPPEDCPGVLANVLSALRAGGKFTLTVPSKLIPTSPAHYRHFDPHEIRDELEAAGFELLHMRGQERQGLLKGFILSGWLDRAIHNPLFSLTAALSIRRKLYLRFINRTNRLDRCGHFVVTLRKP